MTHPLRDHRGRGRDRRGSVYIIVLMTALVVSLIGVSAIIGVRSQFRMGDTEEAIAKSRLYAQSAVELVLLRLALDPGWRADHVNDDWAPVEHVGEVDFTYKLSDEVNANLTDDPTASFRLHTKATVGTAVRHYSVMADMGNEAALLREFRGLSSMAQADVVSNRWWAQYFKPVLPTEATGWWVTSVELVVQQGSPNRGGAIRLYEPDGTNKPSGVLVDEITYDSNDLPVASTWVEFRFGGNTVQDPGAGLCLALTTASPLSPLSFEYDDSGVSETDSAFITGDPDWRTIATDQAMRYRVHGMYVTGVSIVPSTWQQEIGP